MLTEWFRKRVYRISVTTYVMINLAIFALASQVWGGTAGKEHAKYVFLFIGDGMGLAQRNAAEVYQAAVTRKSETGITKLNMSKFPVHGMSSTYSMNTLITDSAAAATALACGQKTENGLIAMAPDKQTSLKTIAESAKERGMKVGIVSSVSIDHATPACFYSHRPYRGMYYEISQDLARSNFDYFAGGGVRYPKGRNGTQADVLDEAKRRGFHIVTTRAELQALKPECGKVLAYNHQLDNAKALYYELDRPPSHISLAEFTRKGIELLDNTKGFFMMVEGGKIDWACHANDAAAAIYDVLAFDKAVEEALAFQKQRPGETLIVVTGDHECGGLTIGFAGTRTDSSFEKISRQKMSYIEFNKRLGKFKEKYGKNAKFKDIIPLIEECFGLTLLDDSAVKELQKKAGEGDMTARQTLGMTAKPHERLALEDAFALSMKDRQVRASDDYTYLLYGSYEPITVKITHIVNQKAGIGWTSYSHTGIPVPVMARGIGEELFQGYYDNTDICKNLKEAMDLETIYHKHKDEKKVEKAVMAITP